MYQTEKSQRVRKGSRATRNQYLQIVPAANGEPEKRIVHNRPTKFSRASEAGFKKSLGLHRLFLTRVGFLAKPTADQIKKAVKALVLGGDKSPARTQRIKDIMYSVR